MYKFISVFISNENISIRWMKSSFSSNEKVKRERERERERERDTDR